MVNKKIYFISDLHLGLYPRENSLEREKKIVQWFEEIKDDVSELYLLGDIFDFWHEHKRVVPKGFTRFMGTLALIADKGVKIHFFSGNHDVWMHGYFKEEIGAEIHHNHLKVTHGDKKFYLAHGDGLGPGDTSFKILRWAFHNSFLQWMFARIHPNLSMWLGTTWSKKSRYAKGIVAEEFAGIDKENTVIHSRDVLKHEYFDYFIYGHRHIPSVITLEKGSKYVNLGDWIYSFTYAVFDGEKLELKEYQGNGDKILRLSVE